jgi:hypothetical protein
VLTTDIDVDIALKSVKYWNDYLFYRTHGEFPDKKIYLMNDIISSRWDW